MPKDRNDQSYPSLIPENRTSNKRSMDCRERGLEDQEGTRIQRVGGMKTVTDSYGGIVDYTPALDPIRP